MIFHEYSKLLTTTLVKPRLSQFLKIIDIAQMVIKTHEINQGYDCVNQKRVSAL